MREILTTTSENGNRTPKETQHSDQVFSDLAHQIFANKRHIFMISSLFNQVWPIKIKIKFLRVFPETCF